MSQQYYQILIASLLFLLGQVAGPIYLFHFMINLNEEIKAQQARLLNIFIQHAKSAIIIIALNYLVRSYITVESLYLPVTLYLTLFMLLFNLTAAVFLMCFKFEFPKLEYFLVYSFNLFTFFSMLVYSFRYFIELPPDTQLLALYVKSYILVTLQKEIEILAIKVFSFEIGNRLVNCFTSCVVTFMILSATPQSACYQSAALPLLSLIFSSVVPCVINMFLNMALANQINSQRALRNFSNLLLFICFLVQFVVYTTALLQLSAESIDHCPTTLFILQAYLMIAPVNFLAFVGVIYQEIRYFQNMVQYQQMVEKNPQFQKPENQGFSIHGTIKHPAVQPRLSLKSLSSIVNNPMENSQSQSRAPNFGDEASKHKDLEKLGTSQFGASQGGMNHSWANVQNSNPFGQSPNGQHHEQQQMARRPSKDESLIRQEESQIPENLSQVNNPMESGSVVTIH